MKTMGCVLGLLMLLHTPDAFAQEAAWTWQNPLPQGNTLHAVHFVDAATGWAVGEAGSILHTADGGLTWTVQRSNTTRSLDDVHFTDAANGWAVGPSGFVGMGFVFHTTDGGATWTPVEPDPDGAWQAVHFADADHGWLAGEQTISCTTDGGQTWTAVTLDGTFFLNDLHFADAQTGWAVGDGGTILHTADGGQTWTPQTSGTSRTLYDIEFIDGAQAWVVGDDGTILRSTDGGVIWTPQPSGTSNALLGIDFLDAETGWISGEGGTILRFTGGGGETGTAVEDEPGELPAAFALAQNYPNPFNPATTILFTVVRQGHVRVQVFDVLGRLIVTLADGLHAAGSYTVTWQADAAPSGVYLYRLQTNTHTEVKKMVLLR